MKKQKTTSCSLLKEQALDWVKVNKDKLINKFCNPNTYPSYDNPFSIFMAGSPGAGKTEFATTFIEEEEKKNTSMKIVHIDADSIKKEIPMYNGKNSVELHPASVVGIEKIHDFTLKNDQNFILDGTFANHAISKKNIERSIKKERKVGIFYIYQDPIASWGFTKIREEKEGRIVPKAVFINAFIESKKNVSLIKESFNKDVEVHLIIKNLESGLRKTYFNINSIDNYIKKKYIIGELNKLIK